MGNSKKLEEAYNLISKINETAYLDTFLLSNQVLSKNPFSNNFVNRFLSNDKAGSSSLSRLIIFKLFKYYFRSFKKFISYLMEFIVYFLNPVRFTFSSNYNELILIDTYFVMKNIKDSNKFTDSCFLGLKSVLDKSNKHYAYLPVFGGTRKFVILGSILRILKNDKVPLLSEYQLLSGKDLLFVLYFIVIYPFRVLKLFHILRNSNDNITLFKSELVNTLDLVTFESFTRFLQGRKIAKLPYKHIKVISWYENQVIDKNLYKGLREANSKIEIYGAQLFLYSKAQLNIIPDENEQVFGIVPDKIIVNGPVFIPKNTKLNYTVGPSLRYHKIFNSIGKKENRKKFLTLLPFYREDIENILRMLFEIKIFSEPIFIKMHPAISIEGIKHLLPHNAIVVNDDIYKLFETTKVVIGSASGTLVEAASLGIPAVVIKNNQGFSCNYLPEYGKGVIWEEVSSPEELALCLNKFNNELDNNSEKINNIASEYRKMFFCQPTEENIIKSFDL